MVEWRGGANRAHVANLYTGGVLDLATHAGGFLGMMNTAVAWGSRSSDRTASRLQYSATLRPVGGPAAGQGHSVIRSSATTWARARDGGTALSARRSSQSRPRRSRRPLPECCAARASAASPSTSTIAASNRSAVAGGRGRRCADAGIAQDRGSTRAQRRSGRRRGMARDHRQRHP